MGCQRSGTTLLRLILECHPEVFCFDEIDSYEVLAHRAFRKTIAQKWIGFKVPRWAEQLDASFLWDYGLPDTVQNIYSGQKILFIVRDYRDAITSMLKLGKPTTWLEQWAKPIIMAKVDRDRSFGQQYASELEICERSPTLWLPLALSIGAIRTKRSFGTGGLDIH